MAYSASIFPASNLSPQAQEWRAAVERRVSLLEERGTSSAAETRRVMGRFGAAIGSIDGMENRMEDLAALSQAANAMADDAVSWHEAPPVSPGPGVENPDVPVNQNATWYVCELSPGGDVDRDRVKEVWRWSPPGVDDDADGKWVQQRWGTDTLGEGAVDYKHLAAAAKGDLEAAKALKGRFDTLSASYEQTKADLEQAKTDLKKFSANAKDVIISDTEPTGADRKPGNLWVSTAGGTTKLYVFDGTANAWVAVKGDDAAAAAAAAAEAQKKAKEALDKAQAVEDMATAAKLAAERAQKSADGKNTIFYQANKPSLNGRNDGDLWYDTDDNYRMYRFRAGVEDFIEAGVSAADLTGSMSNSMVEGVWKQAQSSGAVSRNPVEGSMIANGAIRTAHVQGLDAGVITSGFIGADRIAARSITAAMLAAGTITADSGVIGSLNANDIKFGTLSGDRVDANTLRGKLIEGGTIRGGLIAGANILGANIATTTNGTGDRVELTANDGVRVWRGNTVYAQLHPSLTNGLALYNPNKRTILEGPTAKLTDVSSIIFGAQYKVLRFSPKVNSASDGTAAWAWEIPSPPSGRAVIIAQFQYETGAQRPVWRELSIRRSRNSGVWATSGFLYNTDGWASDSPVFIGMATDLPTSGNVDIWTKMAFKGANNGAFTRWETAFTSILILPA